MTIEFHYNRLSPPSCVVWMVLKELGIDHKENVIDFFKNEQAGEAFTKINPRQQVPAITDGDLNLSESRSIAIYLCKKFEKTDKKDKLYPSDLTDQARFHEVMMRDVDNYHMMLKYLNVDAIYEGRAKSIDDHLLPKCEKVLEEYNAILEKSDYIFGSYLTFLDFTCVHTVSAMAMTEYKGWDKYPNLKKWQANLSKLPYFEECLKKPSEDNVRVFQTLLKKGPEALLEFATQK